MNRHWEMLAKDWKTRR